MTGANYNGAINSISLDKKTITLKVGGIAYLSYSTTPNKNVKVTWSYDESIISIQETSNGIVITGKKEGYSPLTVYAEGKSATCIVSVSGTSDYYEDTSEPYIYSNYSIIQLTPGNSEQINVSLYNGTAADIDGYTWTIDNPAICNINSNGQYCTVSAKTEGYARIKVTHSKSVYPYYIGVYVINDISNISYITTNQNILSLNKADGAKNLKVEMVKPTIENYRSTFNWEILDGADCISILSSNEQASVTPLKSGIATIRVTNTTAGALYPLDINVRVIEIVDNVYIDVDTVIILSGEESKTLTAKLVGIKENAEYSNDDFIFEFEDPNQNICSGIQFSNTFNIQGLRNGSTTLFVKHPKAEYKRQVLVITENQLADSVDSSCYITTSQNYIKTKVGADDTILNVLLKGGSDEDANNFTFNVIHRAIDGSGKEVIKLNTTNGNVTSKMAAQSYTPGSAILTPLFEGEAVITVSHPKSFYPLEILVKVLNKDALLIEPLYLTGEGIITFLNNETKTYNVSLSGNNKKLNDDSNVSWECDNSKINLIANGTEARLTSKVTGNNVSHIYISHPKVENIKDVLVITADTDEDLRNIKALYSNKLYMSINKGSSTKCIVSSFGYDYDETFSGISWTSSNPSIATVEYSPEDPLIGNVIGLSAGVTKITCKYYDQTVTFTITVYPENYVIDSLEKVKYLTTSQNVINLKSIGLSKSINVVGNGLAASEKNNLLWTCNDSSIARVTANGVSGTITGLSEGETEIVISHPESSNRLTIYVRIGDEYVSANEPVTYIAANTDLVAIKKDDPQFELSAYLVKSIGVVENSYSFSFKNENEKIISITPMPSGKCYIKPIEAGQTEIIISHPDADYDKNILVVVCNTDEELAAFKYITTDQNVIAVGQGNNKTINVSLKNTTEVISSGFSFESENPSIASIVSTSNTNCIVKGNSIGTTRIKVTNTNCTYPLYIIVQVVDPIAAASSPYIQVAQPVLNLIESTSWSTVTAELVGGSPDDQKGILWTSSDNTILEAYGQNGVGKVRAKTSGICYLTVSHPKAPYEQRILCICDKAASRDYSISLSSPNILSIKPNAGDQAITATLVNGTNADRNNFNWSLDVYNIVSLTYSGNQAVITPLQEGTCTLTVSHPKSPYDQKIVIKVQSYDSFNFASTNKTIVAGTTNFINMQVPASSVKTHIVYSTSNEKICTISGTSSVAQLTGIASGTCTVKAQLIATATNVVQAESDMLVYVSPADSDAVYISGSPTVYTIEMGEQKTLSAIVTGNGITTADYYNLKWKSNNPDIVEILGASTTGVVMGSQVYAIGKKPGEALITISHEKTNTELIYYVIVPGTESSKITLNKSFITVNKNETTTLKATITGGSTSDYQNIIWTAEKNDGVEICRVMGYGQEVTIYGINSGTTDVIATLPNGSTTKCQVVVESTKEVRFDFTTLRIQPGETKTIKYHVTPATAGLTWVQTDDSYFTYVDKGLSNSAEGEGTLEVTGIKEGNSSLKVATSYGNTATLQIVCSWDYKFELDKTSLYGTPDDEYVITYEVNPPDAKIQLEDADFGELELYQNSNGTGRIVFVPKTEGKTTININAINTKISNSTVFSTVPVNINISYNLKVIPLILEQVGKFSNIDYENNIIYIGDGEDVYLSANAIESQIAKADYSIDAIEYTPISGKAEEVKAESVSGTSSGSIINDNILLLNGNKDLIVYDYASEYEIESIKGIYYKEFEEAGFEEYIPHGGKGVKALINRSNIFDESSNYQSAGGYCSFKYYEDYWEYKGGEKLKEYIKDGYKVLKCNKIIDSETITTEKKASYYYSYSGGGQSYTTYTTIGSLDLSYGRLNNSLSKLGFKNFGSDVIQYTSFPNDYSSSRYNIGSYQLQEEDITLFKITKGKEQILLYGSEFELHDVSMDITYRLADSIKYYTEEEMLTNSLIYLNPYKYKVYSIDSDPVEMLQVGLIKITYSHMGKSNQRIQYAVYKTVRKCNIYQERK